MSVRTQSRPYRDAALYAAMLIILSGVGLTPLGSDSTGKTVGHARLESIEIGPGGRFSRGELADPPVSPAPLDDPQRVRRLLPEGAVIRSLLKGGFAAPLVSAEGSQSTRTLAYAFEAATSRTIESNDGRRVVERVRFEIRRMLKIVADGDVSLDLGPPEQRRVGTLADLAAAGDRVDVPFRTAAEAVLAPGSGPHGTGRATLGNDSLAGKTVRITYVDGEGVQSVEPIGCQLSGAEAAYLMQTPVLADAHVFPIAPEQSDGTWPGGTWQIENWQFSRFLDPALSAFAVGSTDWEVRARPMGHPARLRLVGPDVEGSRCDLILISSAAPDGNGDAASRTIGCYRLRDAVLDQTEDGLLQTARFEGYLELDAIWQDYFLFDEVPEFCPGFVINYVCEVH